MTLSADLTPVEAGSLDQYIYQDYIELGGQQSPGYADVAGAGSPRKWDKRDGYGFSGAVLVYHGTDLAEFDVTISMWDVAQLIDWWNFATILEKAPVGVRAKALDISHPFLNTPPLRIKSVVVQDVSQLRQDEYGLWTVVIKFLEYRAPRPILGKPIAAIPSAAAATPTAQDAADVQIQQLQARVAALAGS